MERTGTFLGKDELGVPAAHQDNPCLARILWTRWAKSPIYCLFLGWHTCLVILCPSWGLNLSRCASATVLICLHLQGSLQGPTLCDCQENFYLTQLSLIRRTQSKANDGAAVNWKRPVPGRLHTQSAMHTSGAALAFILQEWEANLSLWYLPRSSQ